MGELANARVWLRQHRRHGGDHPHRQQRELLWTAAGDIWVNEDRVVFVIIQMFSWCPQWGPCKRADQRLDEPRVERLAQQQAWVVFTTKNWVHYCECHYNYHFCYGSSWYNQKKCAIREQRQIVRNYNKGHIVASQWGIRLREINTHTTLFRAGNSTYFFWRLYL